MRVRYVVLALVVWISGCSNKEASKEESKGVGPHTMVVLGQISAFLAGGPTGASTPGSMGIEGAGIAKCIAGPCTLNSQLVEVNNSVGFNGTIVLTCPTAGSCSAQVSQ